MQAAEPPVIYKAALPPFDDEDGDFVLQTSDNVRFRLCKAIMSRASPVFKDIFTLPHPPPSSAGSVHGMEDYSVEHVAGKPLLRVTEDSKSMDAFLRCCYPVPNPPLDIAQLTAFFKLADKFDADAVRGHTQSELARYARLDEHCFRAYAVACCFGMKQEAKAAARQTMQLSKNAVLGARFPELDLIPVTAFTRLLDYRTACVDAVKAICKPEFWIQRIACEMPPLWDVLPEKWNSTDTTGCTCQDVAQPVYAMREKMDPLTEDVPPVEPVLYIVKAWFNGYLSELASLVEKDHRRTIRGALEDEETLGRAVERASKCDACRKDVAKQLFGMITALIDQVDYAIDKVPFEDAGI